MSEPINAGAEPTVGFDDLVGAEQPVNTPGAPAGEQPKPAEGQPAAPAEGVKPPEGQPQGTTPEGGQKPEELFWGKFKTQDEAKGSYDQAQTKIIEQGTELNQLKKTVEENSSFLSALDKVLAAKPELAEQLKTALAENGTAAPESKPDDIKSIVEKTIEEKEQARNTKAAIDKWLGDHPDFKEGDGSLGNKILDLMEQNHIPVNANNLQFVYDSMTKDKQIEAAVKKAVEAALKKEDLANLDRNEAAAVGGGSQPTKTDTPANDPFGDAVGNLTNPNRVRT